MTTLDQLTENESGTIVNIHDEGLAIQLVAMGFLIGESVTLERIAPLRDPIIITSGTNHVSIRKSDAQKIEVRKA